MIRQKIGLTAREREHLTSLKAWNLTARVAMYELRSSPRWKLLAKLAPQANGDELFDNIDWLIRMVEALDRPTARDLENAVQAYKKTNESGPETAL